MTVAVAPNPSTSSGPSAPELEDTDVGSTEPTPIPEEETVVLGEEETPAPAPVKTTQPAPVETKVIETASAPGPAPTPIETAEVAIEKVLTAPKQGVGYAYTAIALMAIVAVGLAMTVGKEFRHPGMAVRGAGLVAVIIILSFINLRVLDFAPRLPADSTSLSANAISAVE
jgi:hypothetical protein